MSRASLASLIYMRGGDNLGFHYLSLIRPVDFHLSDSSPLLRHFSSQFVKTNGNRANRVHLVDTLALVGSSRHGIIFAYDVFQVAKCLNFLQVRKLETQGLPTKQAEAITSTIIETLNDSLENAIQSFVSKSEMEKIEMIQDSNLSKFKSEMKSTQEHHFSSLQRETGKLQEDNEKLRSELRYEVDKVTAGQRLDLNLERGRIRDELAKQTAENNELTNKLDWEIHALRTQLEAAKFDVIKYCIGTIVSILTVGITFVGIWKYNK